ncbi:phage BR0599 family protein [Salmonella enterica subsp. enterica serovar Newport]
MSYNIIETSNDNGRPVFMYEFRLLDKYWRYTSADAKVSALGSIWEPMGVSDDGIKQTGEAKTDALNLTLPNSNPVVGLFIGTPPGSPVTLTIRRMHLDDNDPVVCYVGTVDSINQGENPTVATVTCSTLSATMDRNGLRLSWSRGCPHALYDGQCRVNKEAFRVDATILTVGAGTVTAAAYATRPDGYFAGGFIEWIDPVYGVERRGIETHTGNTITIFGTVDGLAGGYILKTYPGCPRTSAACDTIFNNLANFGGIPSLPDCSPFDGNPIF